MTIEPDVEPRERNLASDGVLDLVTGHECEGETGGGRSSYWATRRSCGGGGAPRGSSELDAAHIGGGGAPGGGSDETKASEDEPAAADHDWDGLSRVKDASTRRPELVEV